MKWILIILPVIFIAATPPAPPIPKHSHQSAAVHQGAGSAKLIAKALVPAPPTTNSFAWQYPPGVVAANLWWSVEASSDLTHWSVVVSNASGPGEVRVKRTDPPGFYRLSGRSSP